MILDGSRKSRIVRWTDAFVHSTLKDTLIVLSLHGNERLFNSILEYLLYCPHHDGLSVCAASSTSSIHSTRRC